MNKDTLINGLAPSPKKSYTVREAEELAKSVLKDCGYDNFVGAIPIIKIANSFGFLCIKAKDMPKDTAGNIFVGGATKDSYGADKVIVVGYSEDPKHQRFIIAHELAHYLMNYLGNEELQKQQLLFSKAYLKKKHNEEELCPDRFAAELLMPSEIFLKQFIKVLEACDYNKEYAILYLSNLFETKISSIEKRISEVIS